MNQGIGRFALLSLVRVAQGLRCSRSRSARRSGSCSGCRAHFRAAFDPVIQVLRPISPLAWLPLGLVIFQQSEPAARLHDRALRDVADGRSTPRVGVRSISPEYLNVGRVLRLSRATMLRKIIVPGDAALRLHRLPALARARLARDRRLRDADRRARHRRLPLAGVQQPRLLAHPAARSSRSALIGFVLDRLMGVVEAPRAGELTWRFLELRGVDKSLRHAARHARRVLARRRPRRSTRASSSRSSAPRAPARRRWCRSIAGLLAPDARRRSRSTARPSPGPGPTAASSSRATRCCRG